MFFFKERYLNKKKTIGFVRKKEFFFFLEKFRYNYGLWTPKLPLFKLPLQFEFSLLQKDVILLRLDVKFLPTIVRLLPADIKFLIVGSECGTTPTVNCDQYRQITLNQAFTSYRRKSKLFSFYLGVFETPDLCRAKVSRWWGWVFCRHYRGDP